MLLHKLKSSLFLASLVLAGILLTGAFAPFNLWPFAIIAIAYLFFAWQTQANTAKRACLYGWLFGLGFFTSAISWIYISLYTFGGLPLWLAIFISALLIALLALFPAITGYLLNRIFTPNHKLIYLFAFACLWVLMECIRSYLLSGFPWALLAYSQTNSPLAGFIPMLGELGVSWLICIVAALLVNILQWSEAKQVFMLIALFSVFGLGLAFQQIHWTDSIDKPITISAVQASVPQQLKWEATQFKANLQTYTNMTEKALTSDLIIWPESAITLPLQYVDDYLSVWDQRLKKRHKTLLIGLPLQTNFETYYNGLIIIGANHGEYKKRHLVPFGEYPFLYPISKYIIQYFHIPMSNFTPGDKQQPLIALNRLKLASYICYEIAYENLVLSDFPQANLIVNISDDSWFGHSLAAWQQVQIGQFRAIETGRYAIFATNDGITAVTNPQGRFIKRLPRYQKAILTTQVIPMAGRTPIMALGRWRILLSILGILLICWVLQWIISRRSDCPSI